jgi:hypothetical protein
MGLFYRTLIREVREQFHKQTEKTLEDFLMDNKERIQEEYNLSEMMTLLNFTEILREENIQSEKIEAKFKELVSEDDLLFGFGIS